MTDGVLLDTCACLWITHDDSVDPKGLEAVEAATQQLLVFVSAITAWEVATLVRKKRYVLRVSPAAWFGSLLERPGVNLLDLSPDILIESVFLPGDPPSDPSDRMVAATARLHGLTIVTRDKRLLDYANAGHVSALAC